MVYKMNESIIVIQAEATSPNRTNVVFWSHDRGTAKLRMKLVRKNGIPQSLPEGTTVPIRLMFKSATAEGGYGKHDYLATVEDPVNGIVSIVLEDNILGYVGKVEGSVYIDFPNDRSLDTAGRFTFYIKRSPIDDSTPELEDYYFNGFSQTIDKIEKILADGKLEIEQKIAESETQIDAKLKDTNDKITKANQDVATLNTNIDKANDRIDQTNQQISDLGKLKKMYSNSIDFGNYDYSGNPNLSAKLNASSFSSGTGGTAVDDNDEIVFTLDGKSKLTKYKVGTQVPLIEGKQYTISGEIMLESDFIGDPSGLRLQQAYADGGVVTLATTTIPTLELNKWQKLSGSAIIKYASNTPKQWYTVFINTISGNPTGKVRLRKIKIEEGPTATPYQPNLLDAPYYLSKVALGENIKDKGTVFPIKTSAYVVYSGANTEPYIAGQKYTLTMKATKPATQTFNVFLDAGTIGVGSMTPVDGLTDVWQKTFTVSQANIDAGVTNRLAIYQVPNSSVGAVQIDWLKIEKGGTRTPNISQFKYFGEGLKDSNNPNDYSWDVTPEYAEKGLNDSVSLTWIAHRGNNSTAPENSIVAFENVYRHQAIETDIQLTSDNRWVVMHDETVDRTTNGTGKISDMTYDQFRALRIDTGANIDKLTDDEKIPPNLEEFLLICKKNNRIPVVEIKATGGYTKEQLQLIKTISDGIGMTEKTIFFSFNYDMLVLMREIFPFNELQWVYQGTINTDVITKLKTLGLPCGLDINENNASLTKDNVNLLHANRLKIGAWTVEYNSFEKMKDLGIDYITTNSPSGYLKYAELSLLNGFTPTNDNGQVPQFAAELEGGYVFLSFNVKDGANNNQLTEIAKLPDWAIPHEKQYNQCMIRTSSGVSLATFDTQGWKHSTGVTEGTITIGLGWSSRTTWAAGQCIYKID